jgi:MHS family alpha-ketoglutarate permease-like MFS transporter
MRRLVLRPILLVVARLMQGLSVGAEYGTGATYISEMSIDHFRFIPPLIIAGQLLALLTVVLQHHCFRKVKPQVENSIFIGAISAIVVVFRGP